MNALTVALQPAIADTPSVSWQETIEPFLNTLDSPQTRRSYRSDIAKAMQRLNIVWIGEITAPNADRVSRGARRAFGCARSKTVDAFDGRAQTSSGAIVFAVLPATGLTRLTSEAIAFAMKSPTAIVIKLYEVLTRAEQVSVFDVLHDRPHDCVVVALALGAGLRASELTSVKVGDVISDDDGADWLRVMQVLAEDCRTARGSRVTTGRETAVIARGRRTGNVAASAGQKEPFLLVDHGHFLVSAFERYPVMNWVSRLHC